MALTAETVKPQETYKDRWSPGQDMILKPPEYEAAVIDTQPFLIKQVYVDINMSQYRYGIAY
jgi:hypothetical protein